MSAVERTLAIVKPGAVERGCELPILAHIFRAGFRWCGGRYGTISVHDAESPYAEHLGRSYYDGLIAHAISGPSDVMILEREDGVQYLRDLIGPSDPKKGVAGQIRFMYGAGMPDNAIHASDSLESAKREIPIFFPLAANV